MVTGYNICPICKRKYSPKNESVLKIDTGRITDITKCKIYDYVCLRFCKNIKQIVNLDILKKED